MDSVETHVLKLVVNELQEKPGRRMRLLIGRMTRT